jgi:predicted NBD/HSP70 family sugar kinase
MQHPGGPVNAPQGLNQKRTQVLNRSLVLNILRQAGECSRAELARRANLRQATITNITKTLLDLGYIRETGYYPGQGGRRSVGLTIDETRYRTIAARLTREDFTVGLFTVLGTELSEEREKVSVASGTKNALDRMAEVVNRMVERVGRDDILGLGVAVPGPFIRQSSKMALVTGFPGWESVNLKEEIESRIDLPLFLEHDANAGALAEWWIGEGSTGEFSSMVYFVGGQGIGAGIVNNGQLHRGALGTAGEIGHHTIRFDGPQCECGNRGCLELYCSTRAMTNTYRTEIGKNAAHLVKDEVTFDDVVSGYLNGEPVARRVVEEAAGYMAVGLANVINVLNPNLIVIGDEIPAFGDEFIAMVTEKLRPLMIPDMFDGVVIKRSSFADDAMIRGIAIIVAQETLPLD